jgi:hypothetical protein
VDEDVSRAREPRAARAERALGDRDEAEPRLAQLAEDASTAATREP